MRILVCKLQSNRRQSLQDQLDRSLQSNLSIWARTHLVFGPKWDTNRRKFLQISSVRLQMSLKEKVSQLKANEDQTGAWVSSKAPIGTGVSQVRICKEHECTCGIPIGTGVSPKWESERNMSVFARLLLEQGGLPSENMKGAWMYLWDSYWQWWAKWRLSTFDLYPWRERHEVQGQICDILRPQLAMNRFLPLWPHRFQHFVYIHLRGGGVGGLWY